MNESSKFDYTRSNRVPRAEGLRTKIFERRNQIQESNKVANAEKPVVTIGIEAGAFSITIDGKRYHIDQEDDPSIELTKLFKSLGCHVEISEDY